jgi:hypothetical protein
VQRTAGFAFAYRGTYSADDDGVAALITAHGSSLSQKLDIPSYTQRNI